MAGRGCKYQFSKAQLKKIKDLARLNCNTNTIAEAIGVSDDLLNQRPDITAILRKNRALHRIDIREGQAAVAQDEGKSRATMLIWQGKNALGQSDKLKTEHDVSKETAKLLGLIDGAGKGKLPTSQEVEDAGE